MYVLQNTEDEDDEEETEDQVAQRLIKQLIEQQNLDDAVEDDLPGISTRKEMKVTGDEGN